MRRTFVTVLVAGVPVLASAGVLVAAKAPPRVDEVAVTNLASSATVRSTDPGVDVVIPIEGHETYSLTQRAGEPVQLYAEALATFASTPAGNDSCDLAVYVWDTVTGTGMEILHVMNRGEYGWGPSETAGFAAPDSDRVLELRAVAREAYEGCDTGGYADTWTVDSLRVSVVATRG